MYLIVVKYLMISENMNHLNEYKLLKVLFKWKLFSNLLKCYFLRKKMKCFKISEFIYI